MSEYLLDQEKCEEWSAAELAAYFKQKTELDANLTELLENQKVDGKVAPRLTEEDLQSMGIDTIGDRKRVMAAIETLKKAQNTKDRNQVLWQGEEVMYISCWQWCCETCCGCCPDDPEHYTLLYNHLEIKKPDTNRCFGCKCCYGHSYVIDNIDLSQVVDTDVHGIPPPCFQKFCCGAKMQEHVKIQTSIDGKSVMLKLEENVGQDVCRKIKNQVEVMQRMERS